MSDDGIDNTEAMPAPGFADLMKMVRLFADPAKLQAQMDAYAARDSKSRDLEASARRAVVAMNARAAEIADREAKLDAASLQLCERSDMIEARHAALRNVAQSLRKLEDVIKWRILNHAGALEGFDPEFHTAPDWPEIDERLNPGDVHYPAIDAAAGAAITQARTERRSLRRG